MLCVYPADCFDFSSNGNGTLNPLSATVTETLNGEYELQLEHPIDDAGKWQRLVEGCIIRAPVPAAATPRVNVSAPGDDSGREIYRINTDIAGAQTRKGTLNLRSGTGTSYKVLAAYKHGSLVQVIAKTNSSWYEVIAPDGKRGYMSTTYLTFDHQESSASAAVSSVVQARQLRDQPFRIYRIVPELDKITVYARHIFYDLIDNMIKNYKPSSSAVGASVVQTISNSCLSAHDFTFYSDLNTKAEGVEFQNVNPVESLLGEGGVVEKYAGELTRDWWDVFVVRRVGQDSNVQIRQAKNLLGISYDVDLTDVVTRIMPTGEDADGNVLYLPELFVDSPLINSYPHPKWINLEVPDAKEQTDGDDQKTKAQCYTDMRTAVQAQFDAGCDTPTVTLNVSFINCADTEEYREYGFLQNIYLGDAVRVIAPRIGVWVSLRLTQYTYDCLLEKYASMTLGTVADTVEGNVISTRQLPSGIITGSKLAINSVGTGALQGGSVGSVQIKMAAIETAHIQDAAITQAKIGEAAIGSAQIQIAAITQAKIEHGAIGTAQIEDAAIERAKIKEGAIGTAQIEDGVITSAHIGNAEILSAHIQDGAIVHAKIAEAAVGTANIQNAAVDSAQIRDAAITNAKIAGAAIGTANIQDAAIVNAKILDGTITNAKIADLAVDSAKIADLAVTTAKIAQAAITNAQIDNAAIDTAKIALGAITAALIAQGAVGTAQIADASITDAKIVELSANRITAGVLSVERLIIRGSDQSLIYTINNMGDLVSTQVDTLDGYVLTERTILADKIVAHAITAEEIAAKTITANEILAGTITSAEIAAGTITGANIKAGEITTSHVSSDFGKDLDLSSNTGINLRVQQIEENATDALEKAETAHELASSAASKNEVIVGTQTIATDAWTGTASFASLNDGQQILYWLPCSSTGTATLNLTLSDGTTTGDIPCYYSGITRLSTHYDAGNTIHLTYRVNAVVNSSQYSGWWADANYNTDTYDRIRFYNLITAKATVPAGKLIVSDAEGYFPLAASVVFHIDKPILYADSSISASSTASTNYLCYPSLSVRTITGDAAWTGTAKATAYLVGTLSGNSFTVANSHWITSSPADETGTLTFLSLGLLYSSTGIYLYPEHPLYMIVDGVLKNLNEVAYNAQIIAKDASEAALENAASINTLQDQISMKVSQTSYNSDKNVIAQRFSAVEQTASDFRVEITQEVTARVATVAGEVSDLTSEVADFRETVSGYMDFNGDSLSIGVTGSSFKTAITNTEMAFTDNNEKVAYISNSDMYITRARVTDTLSVGTTNNGYFDFVTLPGGMALKWRTGESS